MRVLALLLLTACPSLADTITAPGKVTAVTLYPTGATVTRTVRFSAPAGLHEVIVPGLPADTTAETLRIRAPAGVTVGATSLATDRQPATADLTSPEVVAARAEVERLQGVLEQKQAAVSAIRAKGEAAQARAAFLQQLAAQRLEAAGALPMPEELRAVAALVGDEVLAARQAQLQADTEATIAGRALQPDIDALTRAQAAVAALTQPPEDDAPALVMAVQVETAGEVVVEVDGLTDDAGWSPVYDLRLSRAAKELEISRGVLVYQQTGEDWHGVTMALSTATPAEQSEAWTLDPQRRRIEPEPPPAEEYARDAEPTEQGGLAEPVMEPAVVVTSTSSLFEFEGDYSGDVFSYRFGTTVDIRSGADQVRIAMDELKATVDVAAEAVPYYDRTAYLSAKITNTTGQPLLVGPAILFADGVLVGGDLLPRIPQNGEATIGFGPIHGLTLERTVPNRTEGEEGVLTSSNRKEETAVITVKNLTDEAWPVRLTDRVPYSEQDDLEITWQADPMPAERDPEGKRGLLVWTFDIAPQEEKTIRLDTKIAWPEGMVLQ